MKKAEFPACFDLKNSPSPQPSQGARDPRVAATHAAAAAPGRPS